MNVRARAIWIIAAVVLLDRVSKIYIRAHFSMWDMHPVIAGFFNIVHVENPGGAFGMFADSTGPGKTIFLVTVSIIEMLVIAPLIWQMSRGGSRANPCMQIGLALVFGGALGNFWDRAFAETHTVTDFLQFFFGSYEFPSFNVADSAITIGAGLLLIDLWRSRHQTRSLTVAPH